MQGERKPRSPRLKPSRPDMPRVHRANTEEHPLQSKADEPRGSVGQGVRPAGLEESIKAIAEPAAVLLGLELVDVVYVTESGRNILRVYIDKPGGVNIEDCTDVSRALSAALDVNDPIPQRYTLEVSSPGLDRPLIKESDYVRFAGRKARIHTKEAVEGRSNFKAVIEGAQGGKALLTDSEGRHWEIPFTNIEKARLEIEI